MNTRIISTLFGCIILFSCQTNTNNGLTDREFVKAADTTWRWENYDWRLSNVHEFEYDKSGNQIKAVWKYRRGNEWVISRVTENFYNKENRLKASVVSMQEQKTDSTGNQYDENGNLIHSFSYLWADSIWMLSNSDSLIHNQAGLIMEAHSVQFEVRTSSAYRPRFERIEYHQYDSLQRMVSKSTTYQQGHRQPSQVTESSEYDSEGRLSHVLTSHCNPRDTIVYQKKTWVYDLNNYPVEIITHNFEDTSYVKAHKEMNNFDDHGNLLSKINQRWINGLWVNSLKITNKYIKL